jgi:DNA-binding transcriptional MerR regulator
VPEYRIDELAQLTGTSVRNIRYYQDNRMLPPPRRVGRVGLYDDAHLARLRLITRLLDRGYTAANITELVTAWEQGRPLSEVLGLERELSALWSAEPPAYLTAAQLCELFGEPASESGLVDKVVHAGLATEEDGRYRLASPRTVHAVAEVIRGGAPLGAVLDLCGQALRGLDESVRGFLNDLAEHVLRDRDPDWLPSGTEIPELAALAQKIKPMAGAAFSAALNLSLDRHLEAVLGDYLARILPTLRPNPA